MAPGQHVDGLCDGDGKYGFSANSLPFGDILSSFDNKLLEPRPNSDVRVPIYAFAISIGEAPTLSCICKNDKYKSDQ